MSSTPSASARDVSGPPATLVGLATQEAEALLSRFGPNDPASTRRGLLAFELLHLFLNPLVIILLVASVISAFLGQTIEAALIFVIVLFSVTIDFVQTYRSQRAIQRLQEHVSLTATALRDGQWQEIKRHEIVPGDIVRLSAGDLVPADGRLLEARDLYVQQAALTGESMPAEKEARAGGKAVSNFGNMFSMAAASVFLPFLPMLPTQILLNNFLYDASQLTIPSDNVDDGYMRRPRPWDMKQVRNFMLTIGPISSIYDFLTFYVLLHFFHASQPEFHTGWFVESLATQTLVIFVIRTAGNPLKSRPSLPLAITTILIVATGTILPYSPLSRLLGFVPLPAPFFVFLAISTVTYLALVELGKRVLRMG